MSYGHGAEEGVLRLERFVGGFCDGFIGIGDDRFPLLVRVFAVGLLVAVLHQFVLRLQLFVVVGLANETGIVGGGVFGENDVLGGFSLSVFHLLVIEVEQIEG